MQKTLIIGHENTPPPLPLMLNLNLDLTVTEKAERENARGIANARKSKREETGRAKSRAPALLRSPANA